MANDMGLPRSEALAVFQRFCSLGILQCRGPTVAAWDFTSTWACWRTELGWCQVKSTTAKTSGIFDNNDLVEYSRRMDVNLLAVAADWSFWGRPLPALVRRDVALPTALSERVAIVVQGVRRCGKSTLMQQMVGHYGLDPARCAFLNFEDPRLSNALTWETLEALVVQFRARHGDDGPLTFFLDEIQWVKGWQRWLRSRLDRAQGDRFVVSGSNAHLLSGELGSTLTGRHLVVELFPFSLDEARRAVPDLDVVGYLESGGFPEPMWSPDGDRLRRQYFNDIVERDVRERVAARSSLPLRQLVQMVFESAGAELSLRRLAGATGVAVETTQNHLEACEAAYLVFGVPFFAFSERLRASHPKKYYPIDTGLRRVVVTRTGKDVGKHLECASFLALRQHFGAVSYWRGAGEVDFVVQRDDGVVVPVQVSLGGALERHHRALERFYEQFPQAAEAIIVDEDSFPSLARGEFVGHR